MTQRELLKQALQLADEHPDAEIHFLVDAEELLPEYAWTGHEINKVKLGWWAYHPEFDDMILTDVGDMRDALEENLDRDVSEDEASEHMKRAILIHTRAG